MAYTALYRKYRPSDFANVVGQDAIINILKTSVINNKISHAYLFCGSRGTGKTSVAKIFAHAVNCLDFKDDICGKCDICNILSTNDSDIIEIDAASNNGVDEIRALRDNVLLMPSFCKYKVYIIDEVHMLSTGAFNALLKTLEEPPSHVIFILATTEPNKIPLTILSRCQRFDFKRISSSDVVKRLKYICEKESRVISDDVLLRIAEVTDGGLRDAINLLDQMLSLKDEEITVDEVNNISGTIPIDMVRKLFLAILSCDYSKILNYSNEFASKYSDFKLLVEELLIIVRDASIYLNMNDYFDKEYNDYLGEVSKYKVDLTKMAKILNELSKEIKNSVNQKMIFEIYILDLCNLGKKDVVINNTIKEEVKEEKVIHKEDVLEKKIVNNKEEIINNSSSDIKNIRINNTFCEADKNLLRDILVKFNDNNNYLSSRSYSSIANLLSNSSIVLASSKYLVFCFNDLSDMIMFDKQVSKIELYLNKLFDNSYKVVSITSNEWDSKKNEYIKNKKNNIRYVFIDENDVKLKGKQDFNKLEDSAMDIFGDGTLSVK